MTTATLALIADDAVRPLRRRLIEGATVPPVTHATPDEDEIRARRLERKRRDAIAALGSNWIMHPEYKFNPRHSNVAEIWKKAPGALESIRAVAVAAGRI